MCGRSTEKHGITLIALRKPTNDHEGDPVSENLFSICEECNAGITNCLEPDRAWTGAVMAHKSVHVRLGELLKMYEGEPVDAATLEFVANQDDWKKRLRELRYLGWEIATYNRRISEARVSSFYRLVKARPWPADPTGVIRQYERDRAQRNSAEPD